MINTPTNMGRYKDAMLSILQEWNLTNDIRALVTKHNLERMVSASDVYFHTGDISWALHVALRALFREN